MHNFRCLALFQRDPACRRSWITCRDRYGNAFCDARTQVVHSAGGRLSRSRDRPPNGLEVNPRGQGPRGYGSAARRLPAFEVRGAGRRDAAHVPLNEPARPAGRSRAASGSTSS